MRVLTSVQLVITIGGILKPMAKTKRNHYWTDNQLKRHRKSKIINALERRDEEYMKERQKKISRLLPNSLFAEARIEFISDKPNNSSDMNTLNNQQEGLKKHPNNKVDKK